MNSFSTAFIAAFDFSDSDLTTVFRECCAFSKATKQNLILTNIGREPESALLEDLKSLALQEFGLNISFVSTHGTSSKNLIKTADKTEARLLIIRKEDLAKISGRYKLIRKLEIPVMVVSQGMNTKFKSIVLPLDLTKESREKVKNVIEFSKYFQSVVKILAVRTESQLYLENKLLAYTHQIKNYIKERGIESTIKTEVGKDIAHLVIDYTNKSEADLIMIMNQPSRSLMDMFRGYTIAEKVISDSPVPVISIPQMKRRDMTVSTSPY